MAKKKNRKNGKRHIGIPCPSPLVTILVASAVISLGYLQICGRCEDLSEDIARLESKRREISQRLNVEKAKWARNERIEGIKRGLAKWGIEMELPPPERVVVIRDRNLLEDFSPADRRDRYAYVVQNDYE